LYNNETYIIEPIQPHKAEGSMLLTAQVCVNCKTPYTPDELYCAVCGYVLPHVMTRAAQGDTHSFNSGHNSHQQPPIDLLWGTSYFHHRARLFLHPGEGPALPIPLSKASVVLGRQPCDGSVDIDLAPFRAAEFGVSRRHARIDRGCDVLYVTDLSSTNGTFVNRQRLEPDLPYILRNRAVLRLGQLVMRVQFI
jgi:hypothetical protein